MSIKVLIADDQTTLRQRLRRILEDEREFQVVAEASSGIEAVKMAEGWLPDVAVVDIGVKMLNGIEVTTQILRRSPRTAVLILSMFSDDRHVIGSVKAGARGYLLKSSVEDELSRAVRLVHSGHSFFSPLVAGVLLDGHAPEPRAERAFSVNATYTVDGEDGREGEWHRLRNSHGTDFHS
jgi:two-component system, NarL family, response regulator NreC